MPQPPAGLRPCVAPPGRRPRPAPAGHAGRQTADTDEVERKLGAWHSEESGAIDASGHGGEVEIAPGPDVMRFGHKPAVIASGAAPEPRKIRRAACRGRVCQDGEILGVAVPLQTKTTTSNPT